MENFNNILNCVGIIVIAVGVVLVYDARNLTKKFFSTSDTNTATKTFKIVGFVSAIIGSEIFLLYVVKLLLNYFNIFIINKSNEKEE